MNFRPCIDIHQGQVKQIVGSSLGEECMQTNFQTDRSAVSFATVFADYGFREGHICVLGSDENSRQQMLEVLQAFPGLWQVGGGVNADNARVLLNAGASKVIITSALFAGSDVLDSAYRLSQIIGKENLVLDLSCESYDGKFWLMKDGWRTRTDFEISLESLDSLSEYCSEFLVHGVGVEGKKSGFDTKLVQILGKFCIQSGFVVNYAGGIGTMENLELFREVSGGVLDFTIGSGLTVYGGAIELENLVAYNPRQDAC